MDLVKIKLILMLLEDVKWLELTFTIVRAGLTKRQAVMVNLVKPSLHAPCRLEPQL